MFTLKVTVSSGALVFDKAALRRALAAAGREVAMRTRTLLSSTGSGRTYSRPGGGTYQASSPGQPPALRTGALEGSVLVKVFRSGEGVAIRDSEKYATALEAGAHGGGGLASGIMRGRHRRPGKLTTRVLLPRPYLSRALGEVEGMAEAAIRRAVDDGLTWKDAAGRVQGAPYGPPTAGGGSP